MSETSTAIANIARAARSLNVTLPAPVEAALALDAGLPVLVNVENDAVREIASAFGARNFAKVRDEALARVAEAQAADRVRADVSHALARHRWAVVVEHADEIVSAFAEALAEDLATLNRHAPNVPVSATADSSGLSPDAYESRYRASAASARLLSATAALSVLYSGSGNGPMEKHRLMLTALPGALDQKSAHAIRQGFYGRRSILTAIGTDTAPGLWFAIAAANGATFSLATRAEYRDRFEHLTSAVEKSTEDAGLGVLL